MAKDRVSARRERFVAHPRHTSMARYQRVRYQRRLALCSIVSALCVGASLWFMSNEQAEELIVSLGLSMISLAWWVLGARDYLSARQDERALEAIWCDDSDWAMRMLSAYHTTQLDEAQSQRKARRSCTFKAARSTTGFGLTLTALVFLVVQVGPGGVTAHSWWFKYANCALFVVCIIFFLRATQHASAHSKLSAEFKLHQVDRKAFQRASLELPEQGDHVGGLSELSGMEGGKVSLIEHDEDVHD